MCLGGFIGGLSLIKKMIPLQNSIEVQIHILWLKLSPAGLCQKINCTGSQKPLLHAPPALAPVALGVKHLKPAGQYQPSSQWEYIISDDEIVDLGVKSTWKVDKKTHC